MIFLTSLLSSIFAVLKKRFLEFANGVNHTTWASESDQAGTSIWVLLLSCLMQILRYFCCLGRHKKQWYSLARFHLYKFTHGTMVEAELPLFFFWYMRKNGCVSCTASSENLEGGSKESTFRSGRGKSCLGPRIPWWEKRRGREATSTTQPLITAAPYFYLSRIVLYLSQFLLNSFLSIWGVYLAILSLLVLSAPTCPTAVPSVFCDFKRRGGEGSRILFVCLLFSP